MSGGGGSDGGVSSTARILVARSHFTMSKTLERRDTLVEKLVEIIGSRPRARARRRPIKIKCWPNMSKSQNAVKRRKKFCPRINRISKNYCFALHVEKKALLSSRLIAAHS